MLHLKLSTLAVILGFLFAILNGYGVLRPGAFAAAARKFPRYTPVGYVLMIVSTIWFVGNVSHESNRFFMPCFWQWDLGPAFS